jgi:Poxvirus A32 protein
MILAPSGGGKTVLLQNMILDIYKGCFSRIYIFSPSIDVDMTWNPVKDYLENDLKQNAKKEKYLFDSYQPHELMRIIDTQHKIVEFMKTNKMKKIFQILIIIDDFADDPSFTRNSQLLHSLYIRGRHTFISTITATQVYKALSPIIRKNVTDLYIFKLRNFADMEAWLDELKGRIDKDTLLELYKAATDVPYGFLYIKATEENIDDMFYASLQHKLIPRDAPPEKEI